MSKGTLPSHSDGRKLPPLPLADRGLANSNVEERRPLKSAVSRMRKRNPFSERHRNNFPDLDDVFNSMGALSSGCDSFEDQDDDECCHLSDIDGSSVLNMSIGARAALTDHARHISKYGIDGEMNRADDERDSSDHDEVYSSANTTLLLDNQWERLLDLSQVGSSSGCSIPSPSTPSMFHSNIEILNESTERPGHEVSSSIEVMTDISYDFFNSSRVNLLITPERNKNRRTEMVVTRDGDIAHANRFVDYPSLSFGDADQNDTSRNDINNSYHSDQVESNYLDPRSSSFNIADISRISNNTASDMNHASDASNCLVNDSRINDNFEPSDDPLGPIFGTNDPSGILNDASFSSILNHSSCTSPQRETYAQVHPDTSANSSSSIQSTVSSFIAEAKIMAKQMVSDVEKSIGSMESLQADFLRVMDIGRTDVPSPISQSFSTPPDATPNHRQHGTAYKSPNGDSDISSSIEKASRQNNNSSSLSSSTLFRESTRQTIQLTGRKRYRTVVPRRVYLDSPGQQLSFDEEQDSFVAVQSCPETTQTSRCLLESFEEAATLRTF